MLRAQDAQANNLEETDDQLTKFLRILIKNFQILARKKEGAVAANFEWIGSSP
jgi:hypothetical protein